MYLNYWKILRRPFDERLDPSWFFGSAHHQGMLLKLRCQVRHREPIAILAGGIGCGKSMVATTLADSLTPETHPAVYLHVTPETAADALREILEELHHSAMNTIVDATGPTAQAELLSALRTELDRRTEVGQQPVVFLDAADMMPECEFHGLIRALRELTMASAPAIATVFIGSTELLIRSRRLGISGEEFFPQCVLDAMAPADTAAYIGHRLRLAGGDTSIFTTAAMELIHDLSRGVPRRINRLCDLSLLMGFANECEQIGESLVWTAQDEIRVLSPTRTATVPATRRWRPLGRKELRVES